MNEPLIRIENITKKFDKERGNFDISFDVNKGEVIGILGENGAGKTTLLRCIMGFIRPNKGKITIDGLDAYKDAEETKEFIAYVSGEINYPDLKSGTAFLKIIQKLDSTYNVEKTNSLISRLQLDITAYPKRMSKGMKQKLALVTALGKDKDVLILDEPTIGLDPLMRDTLLEIINEEKEAGKTIIMTSNTFMEVEKTCDKVIFISKGRVFDVCDINELKSGENKVYSMQFNLEEDYHKIINSHFKVKKHNDENRSVEILLKKEDTRVFLDYISELDIKYLSVQTYDLESYFKDLMEEKVYGKDKGKA